jgi:hypothetical protein
MIASALIDEARDFHVSFGPTKHGDTLLLRELSRTERRLSARLMAVGAEHLLAEDVVFSADDIADALTGEPLDLPGYQKILSSIVALADQLVSVEFHSDETFGSPRPYCGRLSGRKLYLAQPSDFQDEIGAELNAALADQNPWADAEALRITLVPLPKDLDSLADKVTGPDEAKLYYVAALVEFMARRSNDLDATTRRELIEIARTDQQEVLEQFSLRSANETKWEVTPD